MSFADHSRPDALNSAMTWSTIATRRESAAFSRERHPGVAGFLRVHRTAPFDRVAAK
jgi:hypothetical protein